MNIVEIHVKANVDKASKVVDLMTYICELAGVSEVDIKIKASDEPYDEVGIPEVDYEPVATEPLQAHYEEDLDILTEGQK
jgi:hypothetical protein